MGGLVSKDKGIWPTIVQQFPPKPKFSIDQIPDLSGRIVIVTGALWAHPTCISTSLKPHAGIG